MMEDKFADFPESHWAGLKCVYKHQGINAYMPEALRKHDKDICVITELGHWIVNAGRFCCKIEFPCGNDGMAYWTTVDHLMPLGKPVPKPPVIEEPASKPNVQEDMEYLLDFLERYEKKWKELQKAKKGENPDSES